MMKYRLEKEYEHYNMWINTKNNCRECYFKDEDPNELFAREMKTSENLTRARAREDRSGSRWNYV